MPKQVTVRPGDCLSSIAYESGFFPHTLWNAAENAELKADRDISTVLKPGDTVYIPDLRQKEAGVDTDARYQFKRHGVPEKVWVRFLDEQGKPRTGLQYRFEGASGVRTGTTDGEGALIEFILPNEKSASVELETEEGTESYALELGRLQPPSEPEGAKARLAQLGCFHDADPDWTDDQRLTYAALVFQDAEGLEVTGKLDDATLAQLKSRYGA